MQTSGQGGAGCRLCRLSVPVNKTNVPQCKKKKNLESCDEADGVIGLRKDASQGGFLPLPHPPKCVYLTLYFSTALYSVKKKKEKKHTNVFSLEVLWLFSQTLPRLVIHPPPIYFQSVARAQPPLLSMRRYYQRGAVVAPKSGIKLHCYTCVASKLYCASLYFLLCVTRASQEAPRASEQTLIWPASRHWELLPAWFHSATVREVARCCSTEC